jgi:hypothetical protein
VQGVVEDCPQCDDGSKKGLLGLLGLLGLIPLLLLLVSLSCILLVCARRRRATKGTNDDLMATVVPECAVSELVPVAMGVSSCANGTVFGHGTPLGTAWPVCAGPVP